MSRRGKPTGKAAFYQITDTPESEHDSLTVTVNGLVTQTVGATGHATTYAPPQNETLTYDDDGNLLSDGRWHYTWNGENRLVKAEEQVSPTNREPYTVEYAYDHQGRMVWKQVSSNAVVLSTRSILWDNYNIIAETIHSTIPSVQSSTNLYVWGLDLSEQSGAGLPRHSAPGASAGGVGGLLAEIQDGEYYFAAFDANGNVTEYLSTNGVIAAHYEYSPFGEIVVQSGELADSFTHRFSTKPWCDVTGLSEYLFRKYEPEMGRWLCRDPMGELVGAMLVDRKLGKHFYRFPAMWLARTKAEQSQLYCFGQNDPVQRIDALGARACWPYRCYWCGCMDAIGLPYPSGWYATGVELGAIVSAIIGAIETFGSEVTLTEIVGAGTLGEWALTGGAILASAWVGGATGCAASAAGEKLADLIPPKCCPDKSSCDGFNFNSPP